MWSWQSRNNRPGINGFTLKCIAMLTMLTDHIGMALFLEYIGLRIIGRIAFPIYCFLLVEGAMHTSNSGRYLLRLLFFAFLSEVPFDLVVSGKLLHLNAQNVFFTLALGLLAIILLETQKNKMLAVCFAFVIALLAEVLNTDYGGGGIFIILCFYFLRENKLAMCTCFSLETAMIYGGLQNYSIFALLPIMCYNGERGMRIKYFFYIFYPAHLLVLYWLKLGTTGV